MFRSNQPSSGVKVVVVKESAALCDAVLFLLRGCLVLLLVNHLFYLGVPELHVFSLSVVCNVLRENFILRYICIFSYCIYDVTYGFVSFLDRNCLEYSYWEGSLLLLLTITI
jgi:hypothetical protein